MRSLSRTGAFLLLSFVPGAFSALAATEIIADRDIVFGKGGDKDLKLDVYRVAGVKAKQPGVLVLYGGAWRGGTKEPMGIICEQFARAGFVACASQYRLCPKDPFPAQVEDAKCAVRWMRANADTYGIDASKIGAAGFSAGGHLALMLGMMNPEDGLEGNGGNPNQSSKVQAVVNYFGPVDLTLRDWKPGDYKLLVDFIGAKIEDKEDLYRRASPAAYIDPKDPPVITFHGTKDPLVPYGQAVLLDKLLKEKGVPSVLEPMIGQGHAWFGPPLHHSQRMAVNFLVSKLKEPTAAAANP